MQGIFTAVCWLVKECEEQMLMGDDDDDDDTFNTISKNVW